MGDTVSQVPQVALSSHIRRYATQAEWETARPAVTRLYVDEKKTLKEVMAIMARDYGHQGTKMYKSRITKWSLDKKTKYPEAVAMLRKKLQRDAEGKNSVFRVRGKSVTVDDLLRYFMRKGIVNPEAEAQRHKVSTPPMVEYWTPLSSPKVAEAAFAAQAYTMDATQTNDDPQPFLSIEQIRRILFSDPDIQSFEISRSPSPPQIFIVPEKLFNSIRVYYTSAIESGFFETDDKGVMLRSNVRYGQNKLLGQNFFDLCHTGVSLMNSKLFTKGRRCFSKVSFLLKGLLDLRTLDPSSLEYICYTLRFLRRKDYNDISEHLRTQACSMATILLPQEHPWQQFFAQLGHLDDSQFILVTNETWRCVCDTFADSLGKFHPITLRAFVTHTSRESDSGDSCQRLHSLLMQGEQELGQSDLRVLDIKRQYGISLHRQGQYGKSIANLQEVLIRCRGVDGTDFIEVNSLDPLSEYHYKMGDESEAESTLREAIRRCEASSRKPDAVYLRLKARLEKWLQKWGRENEAVGEAVVEEVLGPDV